jgi:signal transduction histidine kinase
MALRALVERHSTPAGPAIRFEEIGKARIRLGVRSGDHLYRIAQEALGNALRHADATRITIRLTARSEFVRLEIEDDGRGYRPGGRRRGGIGTQTMSYRARLIGGELAIEARPVGGTRVCCSCPQPSGSLRAEMG